MSVLLGRSGDIALGWLATCEVRGYGSLMTTNKRLTARQLAKALAEIDIKLDQLRAIEQSFHAFVGTDIPDSIGTAWNATHDAISELEYHRGQVELNPRPIPAGEMGTWELVQANID